ncbi:MAG: YcgL domain-containing protein [Gammaproteobacteria bacterium]|nr:YcgL domain-containing protein [Gammaproteobacteria bacterium]MBQ0840202.1 YcgL domain-containing protein [Gammaproteobacteria bacterium]
MTVLCKIYKSANKSDCYLYVPFEKDLEAVPEALLKQLGKLEPAMTLKLTPERKLAQADIKEVLAQLDEQGYYLQMASTSDEYMQIVRARNERL